MKERPILFSGAMVHAILEGRKTQTRRIVKLSEFGLSDTLGFHFQFRDKRMLWNDVDEDDISKFSPYGQLGDRLWVRETFCRKSDGNDMPVWNSEGNLDSSCYWFRATNPDIVNAEDSDRSPWRPSIHMPRWASRILLEITDVRVERLQDISEAAAAAEGVKKIHNDYWKNYKPDWCQHTLTARSSFMTLWDSINGKPLRNGKDISWSANPWVWVVEFKRLKGGA